MANYADIATDKKLAEMERHIARIYKDAYKGLDKSWREYLKGYDEIVNGKKIHHKGLSERYEEEYKAYQQGKYTKQQFDAWYYAQVGRGKRWEALRDDMAKNMTRANQIAAAYVNDNTPGIYSLNANFSAYEIEKGTGIAFNLVNEQTIKNLMQGKNHSEFRVLSVNPKRDYEWNTKKIQNALLSGILQGNSIPKLTERFLEVMGSNESAAIRNCRTAVTSAQNGGRQSTFDRAKATGIELQKEWIATNDSRTRDSHRELDGVRVENENPFPNGCMYPGDPGGEPAEVYNCRCTMRAILPRYNGARRTSAINGGRNTQATYAKWVFEKEKQVPKFIAQNFQDVAKEYTIEEATEICKEMGSFVDEFLNIPSKWSGKIVRDSEIEYGKLWSCDIATGEMTHPHILMHENIHSRSCSYFSKEVYAEHRIIEEGAVQLLTQEISLKKNIQIVSSQYDAWADDLREYRAIVYPEISDLDFAVKLIHQKMPSRISWLRNEADAYMLKNGDIAQYSRISEILGVLGE